jgi:hypothetical protein
MLSPGRGVFCRLVTLSCQAFEARTKTKNRLLLGMNRTAT